MRSSCLRGDFSFPGYSSDEEQIVELALMLAWCGGGGGSTFPLNPLTKIQMVLLEQ